MRDASQLSFIDGTEEKSERDSKASRLRILRPRTPHEGKYFEYYLILFEHGILYHILSSFLVFSYMKKEPNH